MRIGLTNEFFPPAAPGGAEWSMYELGRALAKNNHHVVVMTPNYGTKPFEIDHGIYIYRYPFLKKTSDERRLPGFIWHANILFYVWSALWIYKTAKRERVDLLHAQNKYSLIGTWIAAKCLGIPVICTIRDTSHICRISVCLNHRDDVPKDCCLRKLLVECSEEYYDLYYNRKSAWQHFKDKCWQIYHWCDVHLRRFFLNRVNAVVGVSEGILNVYSKARIFSNQNLQLKPLYNFVQLKNQSVFNSHDLRRRFGFDKRKIVLYIGGITIGKGADDFIKAAKLVKSKRSDIEFVMIGSGAKEEHKTSGVTIIDSFSHEETMQFCQMAELVVVPSIRPEPLSRVILEAMAFGKPVVATKVGGSPEAISDGENGYLVERRDSEGLARAIERILNSESLSTQMKLKALEVAERKFSAEVSVQEFINFYSSFTTK